MLYVVLGAPRSGTSLIAGMLHKAGVSMGDRLNPPQPANPKGFFEDLGILGLNYVLLNTVECDWLTLPSLEQILMLAQSGGIDEVRRVIGERAEKEVEREHEHWGFKSPRMLALLPLYEPVLAEYECHFIAIHRNPLSCAMSFRHAWPERFECLIQALAVVVEYEKRLVRFFESGKWNVTHITFEELIERPEPTLDMLEKTLGLQLAREHLDQELRHF